MGATITPKATPDPSDERLLTVLWQSWRELPASTRRSLAVMMLSIVVALTLQTLDGLAERSPEQIASKLFGMLAGTGGALLLSLAYTLHGATQHFSQCSMSQWWSTWRSGQMSLEPKVLHRLLLALPSLGMVSAVLLSMVLGQLLLGSLAGNPLRLLVAAIYGGMLILAGRTVTRTTRFLYRHAHEQAEAAAKAQAEATEAQLAALQARMNPHFLFNALNTVASLVRTDPKAAESTVENLAGVLRRTLDRTRHTWRTVGDEVDYLRAYLAVEQERWGDRLHVDWSIDPEIRSLPLPPMTLQPLVENALKHGLGPRLEPGSLRIAGERDNGTLRLSVSDDGVGFPPRHREGTGLGNLRRRLATLYGERAKLDVLPSERGARVRLEVPLDRTA